MQTFLFHLQLSCYLLSSDFTVSVSKTSATLHSSQPRGPSKVGHSGRFFKGYRQPAGVEFTSARFFFVFFLSSCSNLRNSTFFLFLFFLLQLLPAEEPDLQRSEASLTD